MIEHYKNASMEDVSEEIDGIVRIEEWRPAVGFSEDYLISSFGRVKSISRYHGNPSIKSQRAPKNGYLLVSIWKDNKEKKVLVHRMVALAFLPNPLNKKTVNHKQGNRADNRVWFLEWATQGENAQHSFDFLGRVSRNLSGSDHGRSRSVNQISKSGVFIKNFDTITSAALALNTSTSHLSRVCNGKEKTAKGYKWQYA